MISGSQRFVKTVDENEATIRFVQEVFDDSGMLIEIHTEVSGG